MLANKPHRIVGGGSGGGSGDNDKYNKSYLLFNFFLLGMCVHLVI